jgi:hypothetical protein
MRKALKGVIIFTAIEEVFLVAWGALLKLGKGLPFEQQVAAALVLLIGLFLEHYVSVNVGHGRAPFGPLPPDEE